MGIENKDYIDKILTKKIKKYKNNLNGFSKFEIENMVLTAKMRKRRKLYNTFVLSMCAVFILFLFLNIFFKNKITLNLNDTDFKYTATLIDEDKPNIENTFTMSYTMNLSATIDYSDINQIKNIAEYIIIAKVKFIDGCINYSEGLGIYTSNNTIGEIEVIKSLKGDLKVGNTLPFIRLGGTIETSEYIKGLNDKRRYLLEQAEKNGQETMLDYRYVKEIKEGDIDIEEGKTYLMFICYDEYNKRYEIFGNQYGLREYDSNTNMVLNNDTHELEDLSKLNIK